MAVQNKLQEQENNQDGYNELLNELADTIRSFHELFQEQRPLYESEIDFLIKSKSRNCLRIEQSLDTIRALSTHGQKDKLFIRLFEYYKTVDEKSALFFLDTYNQEEE